MTDSKPTYVNYGANNGAMIHVDSTNGDVLAYIGSMDYYNEDIDGNVDIMQSLRQPGSSIKPFLYSYGFMTTQLSIDTPMFDIPFQIGDLAPNDADGGFAGLLSLRETLAGSKNIGATKMFFHVGGEANFKPFAKSLGLNSLSDTTEYGYSMALGAGEVKGVELANAYMHLSAQGTPAELNPIEEIIDPTGKVIYQKQVVQQKQLIPTGVAYLLRNILSNKDNQPVSRRANDSFPGINFALKSGTSDMKLPNGQQRARDGWLAVYTPSKVTIFRAGNTRGEAMNINAYGGWVNAGTRKNFRTDLKKDGNLINETVKQPDDVVGLKINKLNGKVATDTTPAEFTVSTLAYKDTVPTSTDEGMRSIQYDAACMGKVSPTTPADQIKQGYVITPTTFMSNKMDLPDVTKRRQQSLEKSKLEQGISGDNNTDDTPNGRVVYNYRNIFLSEPTEACPGRATVQNDNIVIKILKPSPNGAVSDTFPLRYTIQSDSTIRFVNVFVNDVQVAQNRYRTNQVSDMKNITLFSGAGAAGDLYVSVQAIDDQGGSNRVTIPVAIGGKDVTPPVLEKSKIVLKDNGDGTYGLTLLVDDNTSGIKSVVLSQDGKTIGTYPKGIIQATVNTLDTVSYTAIDNANNTTNGSIDLSSLTLSQ